MAHATTRHPHAGPLRVRGRNARSTRSMGIASRHPSYEAGFGTLLRHAPRSRTDARRECPHQPRARTNEALLVTSAKGQER